MEPDAATLTQWFEGPLGRALLQQERTAMGRALECVFGEQCLQVGSWGPPSSFIDLARTQRRAVVSLRDDIPACIRAQPSQLPVQSDSIDALLLPHTLEFEPHPHEVLREAQRVLRPEGCVLMLGFEPLGAWALRSRLTRGGFPPGIARQLSAGRLSDWLKLLGLDVDPAQRFLFTLPFARAQAGRLQRWADGAGRALGSRLSGGYLLVAKKRVHAMTAIRLQFRARPAVLGGLAEPTTRVGT